MKLTLAVVACMALAGLSAAYVYGNTKPVDKELLQRQKFLFEIVYRLEDPLQFEEWIKYGKTLIVDKTKYQVYGERMQTFYDNTQMGSILPRGEFFSAVQKTHIDQAQALFDFFFYAKGWETFVSNVCWARMNVNEGMFVFALHLAVIHRPDMQGLVLPPIYEIMPQMFLNSKFIMKAKQFNTDNFNRQMILAKEHNTQYANKVFNDRFSTKDCPVWQWWTLMGLEEDWHLEDKCMLRNNFEACQNDPTFKAVFNDIKAYWMPVDYTRDIELFNQEAKLSYFTEDVGLNAYWYYLNMYNPGFLQATEFHLDADRRGECWFFNVQQLLAHYYAQRLSVGLGSIEDFSFHGVVKNGYKSQLIGYNGVGFTYRKNYELYPQKNANDDVHNRLIAITSRMDDVIDSGKYMTKDGKMIDLTLPESVKVIGDLLQGDIDILDKQFFGKHSLIVQPNVLQNFETVLRDPITYMFFKKMIGFFYKFKSNLPPYTPEQVQMTNLTIYDAEVSPLKTYFDFVDVDASTLLNDKMVFHDGKFNWDTTLLARQQRLNHEPFNYQIKVKSDVAQKVVVRVYLAPRFDEFGKNIDLFSNTQNFMAIDKFVYSLNVGENTVIRSSKDFRHTTPDYTTYTELYKYIMLALEGKQEYPMSVVQRQYGFPERMILPRGWVSGMPMKMIFFMSPFTGKDADATTNNFFSCSIGSGDRYIDGLPFGYPFDRKIENVYRFLGPNMFVKDVKIYHNAKYEQYYANKYPTLPYFIDIY